MTLCKLKITKGRNFLKYRLWSFLWSWSSHGWTPGTFCGPGCVVALLLVLAVVLVVSWLYFWPRCGCTPGPVLTVLLVLFVVLVVWWLYSWSLCRGCISGPVVLVLLILLWLYSWSCYVGCGECSGGPNMFLYICFIPLVLQAQTSSCRDSPAPWLHAVAAAIWLVPPGTRKN